MLSILWGKTSLFVFLAIALGPGSPTWYSSIWPSSPPFSDFRDQCTLSSSVGLKTPSRITFACSCTSHRSIIKFEMASVTAFLILNFGKPCLCFQQLNTACLFMGRAVVSSFQRDFDSVPSLLPRLFWCGLLIFFFPNRWAHPVPSVQGLNLKVLVSLLISVAPSRSRHIFWS